MTKNKIAFAGFMGAILMSVGAANADIATTTYVQGGVQAAKTYTDTQVGTLSSLNTTDKINTVAAINEVKGAVDTVAGNMVADATDDVAEADKTKKYGSIAYTQGLMEGYVAKLGYDEKLEEQGGEIEALKTKVGNTDVATQITTEINKLDGTVTGTTGVVKTISQTDGKITAARATIDNADITTGTIAKDKLATAVQNSLTAADNALPEETYNTQVGTVDKNNMGTTTATTVVGGIKEAIDAAKAASTSATNALDEAKEYADGLNTAMDTRVTANTNAITTLNGEGAGSVKKAAEDAQTAAVATAKTYTDTEIGKVTTAATALTTRVTTAEGKIDTLTGAATVEGSVANAKKAGTDAAAALDTFKTEQAATDKDQTDAIADINNSDVMKSGATQAKINQITTNQNAITTLNGSATTAGSVDYKIAQAQNAINTSLDGKMDESTALAGKTLTTSATTGQLVDASTVAGTKTTCNAATDGDDCEVVLMPTGTGFKWTKIINTYK